MHRFLDKVSTVFLLIISISEITDKTLGETAAQTKTENNFVNERPQTSMMKNSVKLGKDENENKRS